MKLIKSVFALIALTFFFQSCSNTKTIFKIQKETTFEFIQYGSDTIHARGIAVFNDKIYTANSNGFVYSYDLKNKISDKLNEFPMVELRDIAVINDSAFIAMQSNDKSVIFSKNGKVKTEWLPNLATFFDGIDINNHGFGILMGDPIDGELQVYLTKDFGKTWNKSSHPELKCTKGEAGFAASGTTVQVLNDSTFYFVSGGMASNLYKTSDFGLTWSKSPIPFKKSEASGPFSTHFWNEKNGICVGGDYMLPNDTLDNCFLTRDGGKSWFKPNKTISGYKSCVIKTGKTLYACGTNGIDFSIDLGLTWYKITDENTFSMTSFENKIYATTTKGRILVFEEF
ncbi:MAG: hypothetical protein V4622_09210 [Bacteroidota bacterium]